MIDAPETATAQTDRFLVGIVVGALLLIAAGIAMVLVLGRTPAAPPNDPASPVGVVQSYVTALRNGEIDRSREYLSQSARDSLDRSRDPYPRSLESGGVERRILIELVESSERPERAHVKVTISTFAARTEPFSASTYHREVEVRLVREAGQWRIAQPVDPYTFLY